MFVGLAGVKAFSLLVFILNQSIAQTLFVLDARVHSLEGHIE